MCEAWNYMFCILWLKEQGTAVLRKGASSGARIRLLSRGKTMDRTGYDYWEIWIPRYWLGLKYSEVARPAHPIGWKTGCPIRGQTPERHSNWRKTVLQNHLDPLINQSQLVTQITHVTEHSHLILIIPQTRKVFSYIINRSINLCEQQTRLIERMHTVVAIHCSIHRYQLKIMGHGYTERSSGQLPCICPNSLTPPPCLAHLVSRCRMESTARWSLN